MKRNYDSTVARIAGNLMSGMPLSEPGSATAVILVQMAVARARAIVAETQRTEPVVSVGITEDAPDGPGRSR